MPSRDAIQKKLIQLQAYQAALPAQQMGPPAPAPVLDPAGNPVSPQEQARREAVRMQDKPVESTTPPWEYLQGAAGLAGLGERMLANKAVQNAPAAARAAYETFQAPNAWGQLYRAWGNEVATPGEKKAAEYLAKEAESVPVWDRVKQAAEAFKSYRPESAEDLAQKAYAKELAASAKNAKQELVRYVENTPVPGILKSSASSGSTAILGKAR